MKRILPLAEATVDSSGNKAYYLGKVFDQVNVPDGFVVTDRAFREYLKEKGLKDKIFSILASTNVNDESDLINASRKIDRLIDDTTISSHVREEVEEAYSDFVVSSEAKKAGGRALEFITAGREQPSVVVRPSVRKDGSSFAGVFDAKINVKGEKNLVDSIKEVWKSYYSPEAIYYREKMDHGHDIAFGVVVQKFVNADESVSFLAENPVDNNSSVVEAVYGLGNVLTRGEVNPDIYYLDQNTYRLSDKKISNTHLMESKNPSSGDIEKENVAKSKATSQVLDREKLNNVIDTFKRIESDFNFSPMLEFSIMDGTIYLTDVSKVETGYINGNDEVSSEEYMEGFGVSPGKGNGIIKKSLEEDGDVFVTKNMSLNGFYKFDLDSIVSEKGGFSSKMSRLAREFEIPTVVCDDSYRKLKRGQSIYVDANNGKIFESKSDTTYGDDVDMNNSYDRDNNFRGYSPTGSNVPVTATEIYVYAGDRSEVGAVDDAAGGIVFEHSESTGYSSSFNITGGDNDDRWVRRLVSESDRELWLKTDMKQSLDRDFTILRDVHDMGDKNLNILLSGYEEVAEVIDAAERFNLPREAGLGIVLETIGTALTISDKELENTDFILIDYDSLISHTFGNNSKVLSNKFIRNDNTWKVMSDFLEKCKSNDIKVGLIGSFSRDILKKFISNGIYCLVVGVDSFSEAVSEVKRTERKILLDR